MLFSVQAARGLAALAVVFYHVYVIMKQPEYGGNVMFESAAVNGLLGVNFFFVLSGFIILMAHEKDLGNIRSIGRYLYRRLVRIYPIYWVYLTGYIGAAAVGFGHPDFSWDIVHMASAYTLVHLSPEHVDPPLKVAWTLFYEMKFYLLFIVLLINVRLGLLVFAGWIALMGYSYFTGYKDMQNFASIWNIHFIFGMAAYLLSKRVPAKFYPLSLLAGLVLIAIYVLDAGSSASLAELKSDRDAFIPLIALGFALVLLGVVLSEQHHGYKVPKVLDFLGAASYSVYLVHAAAISFIMIVLKKLNLINLLGAVPVFFFAVVASTIAGCIAYYLCERPLLAALRERARKP